MDVYIGADHRGYNLKEILKKWLYKEGYTVFDCGNSVYDNKDDYPDFAFAVSDKVAENSGSMGIMLCGSGGGATIASNKVKGIRCAQGFSLEDVRHNRDHNDINMLTLGSDFVDEQKAKDMVNEFLKTNYLAEPRMVRRLKKISDRE